MSHRLTQESGGGSLRPFFSTRLCTVVLLLFLLLAFLPTTGFSFQEPDFSRDARIVPGENRENIYAWSEQEFSQVKAAGLKHVLNYPVDVTGLVVPDGVFRRILDGESKQFSHMLATEAARVYTGYDSFSSFQDWMGLIDVEGSSVRLGETRIERGGVDGLTYSCGFCHTSKLFGKAVVGLGNRFARANATFGLAQSFFNRFDSEQLALATHVSPEEMALSKDVEHKMAWVGQKEPVALGLDTSLAQVALSLAKRGQGPWAEMRADSANSPRANALSSHVADSKPATWWGLKYKTRWLLDGSVVSGNPVFTNFLWNELGRATDLKELDQWLKQNKKVVQELTTYVYASSPPSLAQFFDLKEFDLKSAKRGQKLFTDNCARCHGEYKKAWDSAEGLSLEEAIQTTGVRYHEKTPVINVGTDPGRWQGMQYFAGQLNSLQISKNAGAVVEPQRGYVPPPLVGIWARWPYLHNNSVSSLCELLTPSSERKKSYYASEPILQDRDFDFECNGYPDVPWLHQRSEFYFDTQKEGMGAMGHDKGIFVVGGRSIFSAQDKLDLVKFLQTL